jgi:hypothetical protein
VDWVKLSARYYMDLAVVGLDDATEVMFTRALAFAGDQETHGFVPSGILPALCRRRRYETCVDALVASGLWLPVRDGYQITRWQEWQAELEAILARRSADRDRKRRERQRASTAKGTASRDTVSETNDRAGHVNPQVNGMSRDMSTDTSGPYIERREEEINPPHPSGASPPRKRGTRIPGDFAVTPEMAAWAQENVPYVNGRAETERFTDYWRAKAGRDACKLDWIATWRNWMRRAGEQQAPRGRGGRHIETENLFDRAMARAEVREEFNDAHRNGAPDQVRPRALPAAGN